jgi:hypothetical protein
MRAGPVVGYVAAAILVTATIALSIGIAARRSDRKPPADTSIARLHVVGGEGEAREIDPAPGVIVFVSATCRHCRAALASLGAAPGAFRTTRLTIISIDTLPEVRAQLDSLYLPAQLWMTPARSVHFSNSTRLTVVPTLYWIGAGGRILDAQFGELSPAEAATWIERAR